MAFNVVVSYPIKHVTGSYPPMYEVTISSSSVKGSIPQIVGIYIKTEQNKIVHHNSRPIYKKRHEEMFLFQEPLTGDWVIAEDFVGTLVLARQPLANYQEYPDNKITWSKE